MAFTVPEILTWKILSALGGVNVGQTDRYHFQVVVRGGYYLFKARVSGRNGPDALRASVP